MESNTAFNQRCPPMVERARRAKGKQRLLASHPRSWLWGRNLVSETLRAGQWSIVELILAAELPPLELQAATARAEQLHVKWRSEPRESLTRLCHSAEHQGYLARMGPFPYADLEATLARRPAAPLYVLVDGIQDPYNFGALLRSAEVFAVDAVFIGSKHQVPVNSLVARSSAGAVNRVSIVQMEHPAELAARLRTLNVQVIGASEKAEQELAAHDFREATAIVVGNEGQGISPALAAECASLLRIPQGGAIGSLNVAAAAAIFFYEARRQRGF